MKELVSIIVPFYNESESIPGLINALDEFISSCNQFDVELIFVDDGSKDDSKQKIIQSRELRFKTTLICLSKNYGSHAALRAGILHANGDFISFLYADLQDPPELISSLFLKCKTGYDITWAVRAKNNNGLFENLFSRFYSTMMQRFAVDSYPRKGFDIIMFSKKIREIINQHQESNSSLFIQILNLGFSQATIEYNKRERKKGKSKWTLGKKIKLFIDSFVAFSYAPIRLVSIVGIILFIVGLSWSAYLVLRKLIFDDLASGWPALMAILSIGFGITNISLGIIAEYLWRTLDSSRKRPAYLIDEIIIASNSEINNHINIE
jgi:glycosyltransferase involved in cell wall biosynthesis